MHALHWDGTRLSLESAYPSPVADASLAIVRVHLAGICATDIQIFQGYMGFQGVPGHEFVGTVSAGPTALLGKRVVGEINFACDHCPTCQRGLARHCPARRVMGIVQADGSFAEYVAVPVANLHLVPDSVCDEAAVFVEPLAAACEILEQVHVHPSDEVAVLGDGKLGLLCAQLLHSLGVRLCVVGKHVDKLARLRALGIATAIITTWRPQPADVVIEATGSTAGMQLAMDIVRPRGTIVLKSTVAAVHNLSLAPLVINEVTLVGSRCGPFPPALQALEQQRVVVTPLIAATYPLRAGLDAVAHAARPGTLKVLLRM